MKRIMAWLLTAALLLSALPALGEETWFESANGYSFFYDDTKLLVDTETVPGAEIITPKKGDAATALSCRYIEADDGLTDWTQEGYIRAEADDPEFDLALRYTYAVYESPDETVEELMVTTVDGDMYLFSLSCPAGDPQDVADQLRDLLGTLEFPSQPAVSGSFRLDFWPEDVFGSETVDIVLDEEAQPLLLLAMQPVSTFVMEEVIWDEDAYQPIGFKPIYTAERLTAAEPLRLYCFIPDGLPFLRIRCYNGAGEEESYYLSQSGRDGSLMLLDEEE